MEAGGKSFQNLESVPPWKSLLSAPRPAILSADKAFLEQLVRLKMRDNEGQYYLLHRTKQCSPNSSHMSTTLIFYFSYICL